MKKVGLCFLTAVLCVCFISMTNAEGVKVGGLADSAKEITITGGIDLLSVYRDTGLTSVLDGVLAGAGATALTQNSEFFTTPLITLNFDADLGEKVSGYIRLENRQFAGEGSDQPTSRIGASNTNPAFRQAYVKVSEFIDQKLTFVVGIQDLKYTLRKGEGALFLDVANFKRSRTNVGGNLIGRTEPITIKNDGTVTTTKQYNVDVQAPILENSDYTEFGGWKLCYGDMAKDNFAVDFFYGTLIETGVAQNDTTLVGVNVDYKLPGENNLLKVIVAQLLDIDQLSIMTIGVGADYWAMPNLDVYGEVYSQSGDINKDMTHAAMAMRLGGTYKIEHELKPYVGLSYWSLSGNKVPSTGADTKNEGFISLGNVQSTLILEDRLLGLGFDNNYTAIKIDGGITTSLDINKDGKGEEVSVKLLVGMFNALQATPLTATTDASKKLGTEIDVAATLKYTQSLSFTLGLGMLSGGTMFEDMGFDTGSMKTVTFDTKLTF